MNNLDVLTSYIASLHAAADEYKGQGKMQIMVLPQNPDTYEDRKPSFKSFPIGNTDYMTSRIVEYAKKPHCNVYASLSVFRNDLPAYKKGGEDDVVAVLGVVADFDDPDAAQWANRLPCSPDFVLETSQGRFQAGYLFNRPRAVAEAKPIAVALQAFANCDFGTEDVAHVWRLPGTGNWPNAGKIKAGRVAEAQPVRTVRALNGTRADFDALAAALGTRNSAKVNHTSLPFGSGKRDLGLVPSEILPLLDNASGDRSGTVFTVTRILSAKGYSARQIEQVFRDHPACGAADKYGDRLLVEIERVIGKRLEPAGPVNHPKHFDMTEDGLYHTSEDDVRVRVCGAFEVLAQTRDDAGSSWGLLLKWADPDRNAHTWAMPRELLSMPEEVCAKLRREGLEVLPRYRTLLFDYLAQVHSGERVQCVSRVGWHGAAYVLPDVSLGTGERLVLQAGLADESGLGAAGDLTDWRDQVGARCVGNSRLLLAVSAAFAGPLLHLSGENGIGLHLVGSSQSGKTTALRVAASVWGSPAFIQTWRATSNGLEGVAAARCDGLLVLDEMGEVNSREAGEVAYMLANGMGKRRAARDGSARPTARWRLAWLSSGEVSLADKMAEAGQQQKAGQAVRLLDVPADAGAGMGLFEEIHGSASPAAFAEGLRQGGGQFYGTAARAFLEALCTDVDGAREAVRVARDAFVAEHLPAGAEPQVGSVCGRFAFVGAAGEYASRAGVTGWPRGEAATAAAACFHAWLDRRDGSTRDHEAETGVRAVKAFVERHAAARFQTLSGSTLADEPVSNRVGFRRKVPNAGWQYLILPEQWRSEVCKGFDIKSLNAELVKRGLLLPDGKGRSLIPVTIDGKKMRLYVLSPDILGGGDDDEPPDGPGARNTRDAPVFLGTPENGNENNVVTPGTPGTPDFQRGGVSRGKSGRSAFVPTEGGSLYQTGVPGVPGVPYIQRDKKKKGLGGTSPGTPVEIVGVPGVPEHSAEHAAPETRNKNNVVAPVAPAEPAVAGPARPRRRATATPIDLGEVVGSEDHVFPARTHRPRRARRPGRAS